ncbi:MAG: 2Fe-2S iron-sulfur cluster-binding protein, partial [bacterium]|nr:2Fe-2S iron-sulfur cluster-binding protein [bacterium]
MTLIEAPPTVSFRLNGEDVAVRGDHPHLLAALREELGVISPKDGCAPSGQCGCCTVLVGGRAVVSCQVPLTRVKGKEVITVEGLDPVERDRLARGFAATGALQCGFCTPGIVIRTKALIDQKGSSLDRKTINGRLGAHLCRCTGYTKIVEAI